MKLSKLALFGAALLCSTAAYATSITYTTGAGAMDSAGEAVSAQAVFTTNANGTVSIDLSNLIVNQKSVGQNVSDLFFTLSNGNTANGSSSSGNLVNVASGGTATSAGSSSNLGWNFTYSAATGFHLDALNGAANTPAYTILGAPGAGGTYSNANASIAGNGPHNPFVDQTGHFTLTIAGVTAATTVTSATFSFGTTPGDNVPGGGGGHNVPDNGTTLSLLGASILGVELLRRSMRKSATAKI